MPNITFVVTSLVYFEK